MYRFLKNFKKEKKQIRLTQNQTEEIIELAKQQLEAEKLERELIYILEKFPEIYQFILKLNERVIALENINILYV